MAAPITALQPVKLATGPSSETPEQRYWKTFKGKREIPSPANTPINHISFNPLRSNSVTAVSESFVVATGARVQIFSAQLRKGPKTISRFDDVVHGADIRRDGRVIAAGDDSGTIQVFDVGSRAILKTWKEHKQPVWTTKFSPFDVTSLMSTSDDMSVRLWDLAGQESIQIFKGHEDYVRSGAFMPGQSSGMLVSGSYDSTVKLWDPRASASAVMTFRHAAPVEAVLPMPTGTTVLAATGNQISVLDIVGGKAISVLKNHQKTVTSLCLASKDTRLVTGGLDGHVKVYETTGWNVVAGSKYQSPVLALNVISSGSQREDRHIVVGLQSGLLSIKTRSSGQQRTKEKERQKEMQALMEGNLEDYDRKKAKKLGRGWEKRLRGRDFAGEGADVIIQGNPRGKKEKMKPWRRDLRDAKYGSALDLALVENDPRQVVTMLGALREDSAMRTALQGRDEISLQPILRWICKYIIDPRYVPNCVHVGKLILDLYSQYIGQSKEIDGLMRRLHQQVKTEVDRAQLACETEGMIGLFVKG